MTYQQWLMLQRNKYPGIRMQPSRPGPYGEPQFAHFGGRPAWMDQKQPPPPETWGGLLTSMGGAEDRLDSMPDTETTTVIKESLDPEVATTKTTTIKGDPSWKGSAAFADQDVGMGGGGPFIGLGDPRNVRAGPDMPPGYAPNPAYAPPGSSPSMGAEYPHRQMSSEEALAAAQGPIVINGQQVNPEEHVGVGSIASRLGLSSRLARMQAKNRAAYAAQQAAAKKAAALAAGVGAAEYARREIFQGEGEQPVTHREYIDPGDYTDPGTDHYLPDTQGNAALNDIEQANIDAAWKTSKDMTGVGTPADIAKGVAADRKLIDAANRAGVSSTDLLTEQTIAEEHQKRLPRGDRTSPDESAQAIIGRLPSTRRPYEGPGERGFTPITRPRGTMGEGGVSQQGIGELPKINNASSADMKKMRDDPNLEQIWGRYAYDPAARKKAYLDNLKKIYRKAMLLDAIAALTGGESRSKQYLQMATGRLDAIDKFDEEERVSNIWREVFTNDEGKFDMPASKTEAARRAAQLGASPKTIKDIFGSISEEKKRDQYFKVDPNDPAKWEIKRFDSDPGEEWIRGTPTATSPVKDKSTYHIKNLRHWESLKKTDPELADSFGRQIGAIPRDKTITPSKWASIIAQDISTGRIELPAGMTGIQFIQDFLTNDEVEYVGEDGKTTTLPGYNKWMGKQPTKDEVESAVKESGSEDETDAVIETDEVIEARVRAAHPDASDADIRDTVEAIKKKQRGS